MFVKKSQIAILTDGSGAFTGYSDVCQGQVLGLIYTPDPNTPLTGTPTFTVTTEDTGQAVLTYAPGNANAWTEYPQSPVHAVANGAAITGRSEYVPLGGQERVKLVVSGGGAAKLGTLTVLTGGQ